MSPERKANLIELDRHEVALRCIAYSNDRGIMDASVLREFALAALTYPSFSDALLILIDAERNTEPIGQDAARFTMVSDTEEWGP